MKPENDKSTSAHDYASAGADPFIGIMRFMVTLVLVTVAVIIVLAIVLP